MSFSEEDMTKSKTIKVQFAIFSLMTILLFGGYGPVLDLQTSINIEGGTGNFARVRSEVTKT